MPCRALRPSTTSTDRGREAVIGAALVVLLTVGAAAAERADRNKPLTMEADRPCTVDLVRQVSVCSGNVVIAQGALVIRADRVELRELPDGYRTATAIGTPGKPATYRQRRDSGEDELEGSADRLEYDARSDTVRFVGNAQVRRLRGSVAAEDIQGNVIVWDNAAELFSVQGGAATPSNPSGRVRAVLSPRADTASAASAPVAATPLQSSSTLGERR